VGRIPFERAVELANQYGVYHLLEPIFDYSGGPEAGPIATKGGAVVGATPSYPDPPSIPGSQTSAPTPAPLPVPVPVPTAHAPVVHKIKRARESVVPNGADEPKRVRLDSSPPTRFPAVARPPASDTEAWKLRRSTKASSASVAGWSSDPARLERHKSVLKDVFGEPQVGAPSLGFEIDGPVPNLGLSFPADMDPDTPMDDNDHTALHWAAALGRVGIVRALATVGADLSRGNNVGETALIRAVLVTNNSDQDSFAALLAILGPTLRTVDDTGRTVLHHAALVAGVKGRATSARYYMQTVLEFVAKEEHGMFRDLVDAQDKHGDTALNIAAKVGNRALVRILLDVGADKAKENKLGLRPVDFGVDGIDLSVSEAEEVVSSLRSPYAPPLPAASNILASLSTLFDSLQAEHSQELAAGTASLAQVRAEIQTATRELATTRAALSAARERLALKARAEQRVRNLEHALTLEDAFDWTGRTEVDGTPAAPGAGAAFAFRGAESTLLAVAKDELRFPADPELPETDSGASLVQLKRLQEWYGRVLGLLKERCAGLEGGDVELEERLRRVVGGCCDVSPDKVDGMLDGLVMAMES